MSTTKIKRNREYTEKVYDSRLSVVESLHNPSSLTESMFGKALVDVKNHYHDIRLSTSKNMTKRVRAAHKNPLLTEKLSNVMPLVDEIDFITNVVHSIRIEDHNCRFFRHLIENLEPYMKHLGEDHAISMKLRKHESLLRTLYHKDEIESLNNAMLEGIQQNGSLVGVSQVGLSQAYGEVTLGSSDSEDVMDISAIREEHGDARVSSALYHLVEHELEEKKTFMDRVKEKVFGPQLIEEKFDEICKVLEKRSYWLSMMVKFKARMAVRGKVKHMERLRRHYKKKSAKTLDLAEAYHKELDHIHEGLQKGMQDGVDRGGEKQ